MNTIAHLVVASATLAEPEKPKRNWAIAIGAIVPDASMFVFFAWSRVQGWSGNETWNERYWTEPWQILGAISNSFVLFGLVLALALWRNWSLITVASIAALLHIGLDFPLHADDAHRHFWPVADWRFFSPVSYWDPQFNGLWGSAIETIIALGALSVLWRRFPRATWRIALGGLAALQLSAFGISILWAY